MTDKPVKPPRKRNLTGANKKLTRKLPGDRLSVQSKDPAYSQFVQQIGGKQGLKEVAEWNTDDPRAKKLLEYVNDPLYDKWAVKRLAQEAGIPLHDLALWFRDMIVQRSLTDMHVHIPKILQDAAVEAQAGQDVCPACEKRGQISLDCLRCQGTGRIRVKADKDAREFVGKVTKLTEPAPLIQNNIDNRRQTAIVQGGQQVLDSFEDMVKRSKPWERKLLSESTQIIEAHVVGGEDQGPLGVETDQPADGTREG